MMPGNFMSDLQQGANDDANSIWRAIVENLAALVSAVNVSQNGRLVSMRPLGGGDELLYTASEVTSLREIIITNVTGASATDMRLHHVAAGGTPDQQNALYYDYPLADGATLREAVSIRLAVGDMLYGRAATGGNITFNIYGS